MTISLPSAPDVGGPSSVGLPGVFLTFEGGDGAGKTTQVTELARWLHGLGHEVVVTREPGGTALGRELRAALLHGDHVEPRAEALLYAADRAHHVASLVRPALARGAIVVGDRYLDSSVAYQGSGRELGADEVEALSLWGTAGLLPDLTVLLDLAPGAGLGRVSGTLDRLESAGDDFHARTRQAFLDRAASAPAAGRQPWLVLDAGSGIDELAAQIRARVRPLLAARGLATDEPADDA